MRKSGVKIALAFSVVFTHCPCGLLLVVLVVIFRLVADEIYLYFCCLNLNIDYQEDNNRKKCRISRSKVQSRPLDTFLRSGGIPAA